MSYQRPSAVEALELLISGNQRFISGMPRVTTESGVELRRTLAREGQSPFAVVLTCGDSRVVPELIFDRSLGDLFVIRVAGNVVMPSTIASVEFAVQQLSVPLCVVLGHSLCGAVQAALKSSEQASPSLSPHLSQVVARIMPAVAKVQTQRQGVEVHPHSILDAAILENVRTGAKRLPRKSDIIARHLDEEKLTILGGVYDLESGQVDFDLQAIKGQKIVPRKVEKRA